MSPQTEALAFSLEHDIDFHVLAIALAKGRPELFVKLANINLDQLAADFLKAEPEIFHQFARLQATHLARAAEIKQHMESNNLIGAIKVLREIRGLGLKEAKDVIVALRDSLTFSGKLSIPAPNPGSSFFNTVKLDAALQDIHDALYFEF